MHGIVMTQFRQMVVDRLGRQGWEELTAAAGLAGADYKLGEVYPDEELMRLVLAAVRLTGTPLQTLLEDFGVFLAPTLLRVYEPLVDPRWRTLDVIEHTEAAIHTVVRIRDAGAAPPALLARRVSTTEVEIDYRSERKLCSVARGIATGMAAHFGERITITESECMHRRDGRCLISVVLEEAGSAA